MKKGFSFIELLIVFSITGILSLFSWNFFYCFWQEKNIQIVKRELIELLQHARKGSLIQSQNIVLQSFDASLDWSKGVIIYEQNISNKGPSCWHWSKPVTIRWYGSQSKTYLIFSPQLKSAMSNGYFKIQAGNHCIQLTLNRVGHIRESYCL